MSGFLNNSVTVYPIKLKIGMLDHMNNTFRNTVSHISVDVPLTDVRMVSIVQCLEYVSSETNKTHGYKTRFLYVYKITTSLVSVTKKFPSTIKYPYL